MFKFRLAILVAGAALAFGAATVMAMPSGSSPTQHGALVSKAAQTTCRSLTGEARGDCVSAIASTNGKEDSTEGQENNDGARAKAVAACKVDTGEDATETTPAAGDRAAQAKDRTEDRTERQAVVACITGKAPGTAGS